MKKRLSVVVGSVTVAALLAGCGGAGHSRTRQPDALRNRVSVVTRTARPAASTTSIVYQWGQFGGGQPFDMAARDAIAGRLGGSPFGVGAVHSVPTVVHGLRGTVTQIATSNSDSYALTRRGVVYAWGPGSQGELGDGTRTHLATTAVRVHFPAGVRIAALSNPMPYDGGMAISTGGVVWAWGNDNAREFCQPRGAIVITPIRVPLAHVTLAVGALRHAVYDASGRIVSCGAGPNGQLGNGTHGASADTGRPVPVRGLQSGRAVALTSGWGNAGVLDADGRYYDWGFNRGGQVGDGTRRMATTAVHVALPRPVRRVFEGGSFADNGQTMAILDDGTLWEWGSGTFGQLGQARRTDAIRPVELHRPAGAHFVTVASGGSTNYAIDRSGRLWSWGNNRVGQLGDGSARPLSRVPVRDAVRVAQVASTAHNVAALARPGANVIAAPRSGEMRR